MFIFPNHETMKEYISPESSHYLLDGILFYIFIALTKYFDIELEKNNTGIGSNLGVDCIISQHNIHI